MSHRVEVISNVLAELLNYILAAAIEIVLFKDFIEQWPGMGRIAALAIVPVFYYMLREFCQNPLLFFALHIIPGAGIIGWWGRSSYEKAVMGGTAVLFALFSIGRHLRKEKKRAQAVTPLAAAGGFCLLYLADSVQGFGKSGDCLIQMLILYLIGYFLQFYLVNFLRYMDMNSRTMENIPQNRAFYTSFGLAAGFTGMLAVLFYGGTHRQQIDAAGAKLGKLMAGFIAFLLSFLPKGGEKEMEFGWQVESGERMELPEAQEASFLAQILDVLLFFIAAAVAVVLIIGMIAALLRLIKEAFWGRQKEREINAGGKADKVESLLGSGKRKGNRTGKKEFFWTKTPEQEIRRVYYKTLYQKCRILKEERTLKLLRRGSAKECCLKLFPERQKEAMLFAELYEKARYGNGLCGHRDVKLMKQYANGLTGRHAL